MFRMLALHPGRSLTSAASLAGVPRKSADTLLANLADAHLLTEHEPGRRVFHDLLRAYAEELVHTHDSADEREHARARLGCSPAPMPRREIMPPRISLPC